MERNERNEIDTFKAIVHKHFLLIIKMKSLHAIVSLNYKGVLTDRVILSLYTYTRRSFILETFIKSKNIFLNIWCHRSIFNVLINDSLDL